MSQLHHQEPDTRQESTLRLWTVFVKSEMVPRNLSISWTRSDLGSSYRSFPPLLWFKSVEPSENSPGGAIISEEGCGDTIFISLTGLGECLLIGLGDILRDMSGDMSLLSLGASTERGKFGTSIESLEEHSGSTEEENELLLLSSRGGGTRDRPEEETLVFTHIPSLPLSLLAVLYTALGREIRFLGAARGGL